MSTIYLVYWAKNGNKQPIDACFSSYDEAAAKVYCLLYEYQYQSDVAFKFLKGALQVTGKRSLISWEVEASISAYSATNKPLDVKELFNRGKSLSEKKYRKAITRNAYFYREGSVEGINRSRIGRYYRKIATTQERREVAGVLNCEGEPDFRGNRRCLPNSWDDISRTLQRCWKRQHKGAKSWDKKKLK